MISSQYHRVQMLEELDRFQVLVIAVLVCDPLAVLLTVIQVEHGGHGINT